MNSTKTELDQIFSSVFLSNLVSRFTWEYRTFDSPKFVDLEASYKRAAQERFQELLSQPRLDQLISEGQFEEAKAAVKRACSGTFDGVQNNLLNKFDMLTVTNAPAEPLVIRLYDLLYGTGSFAPRFEAWVDLLSRDKPGVWPTATYFLMMHDSTRYIFVKAEPYKKLLHALRSKLEWETRPTARRYSQILMLASTLLEKLAPLGAKDMIDIQSFIYVLFPNKE